MSLGRVSLILASTAGVPILAPPPTAVPWVNHITSVIWAISELGIIKTHSQI